MERDGKCERDLVHSYDEWMSKLWTYKHWRLHDKGKYRMSKDTAYVPSCTNICFLHRCVNTCGVNPTTPLRAIVERFTPMENIHTHTENLVYKVSHLSVQCVCVCVHEDAAHSKWIISRCLAVWLKTNWDKHKSSHQTQARTHILISNTFSTPTQRYRKDVFVAK